MYNFPFFLVQPSTTVIFNRLTAIFESHPLFITSISVEFDVITRHDAIKRLLTAQFSVTLG